MKAFRANFVPINHGILWSPDASQATPRVFDDLDFPAELRLDPLAEAFLLVSAIGPDQLETRKASLDWGKQELAPASILNVGFMHQHMEDQPMGID